MGTGEVQVGQGIHLGLFHDGGCLGTALLEHLACQVVGTTHHTRVLGPEDRGGSLELLGYGALEALVGVRDDELGPVDATLPDRGEEALPGVVGLGVHDRYPQHAPPALFV